MTWETVTLSLFDGFLGAIIGGAVAAVIALRTTKTAIEANAAAQDRDRALTAALRIHEFATEFTKVAAGTPDYVELPEDLVNELMQAAHLALKTAEFARPDDSEFVAWLRWLNTELVDVTTNSRTDVAHIEWVSDAVGLLERRLLAGDPLIYPVRPAGH
ncbi:hypothetical protein AB1046_15020 [Promicromonospora sp. Populi]|uniref:hypothetical protein n=1 Tax=Promicromonospora sp. Populi TaxID=3239420 RepID=UPI0034E2A9B6